MGRHQESESGERRQRVITASRKISDTYYDKAAKYEDYSTPHHGWAIIKEELDELWDEIRKRPAGPGCRSKVKMADECADIAAAALKFMVNLCEDGTHRYDNPYKCTFDE
jgi:NTP pyrophosphatase (non-canonical NTP hydrolase)